MQIHNWKNILNLHLVLDIKRVYIDFISCKDGDLRAEEFQQI